MHDVAMEARGSPGAGEQEGGRAGEETFHAGVEASGRWAPELRWMAAHPRAHAPDRRAPGCQRAREEELGGAKDAGGQVAERVRGRRGELYGGDEDGWFFVPPCVASGWGRAGELRGTVRIGLGSTGVILEYPKS